MGRSPIGSPRARDLVVAVGFVLAIGAVATATLVAEFGPRGGRPRRPLPEERLSAARPALPTHPREATAFPPRVEAWYADVLPVRATLLAARNRLLVQGFGVSPTPVVHLGRDGWVFLTEARQIEVQRGLAPFRPAELERWTTAVRARARWCRERGIVYVCAIAPDKTDVYRDRHGQIGRTFGPTRLDQLAAALADEPALLDLRDALRAERERDRPRDHAYFPYGSHWTDRGACGGVHAILARVNALAAAAGRPLARPLEPFAESEFILEPDGIEGDTWAGRLYLTGVWRQAERGIGEIRGPRPTYLEGGGEDAVRNVTTMEDPAWPRLVVFHDSFGLPVVKFLARRASRGVFLRGDAFRPEVAAAERPDVVVELFCERVLVFPPLENLPEQAALTERRFERAAPPHYVFDPARDAATLRASGVRLDPTDAGLRLSFERADALAPLPAAILPTSTGAPGRVLLRFEVDAEHAGELLLFHATSERATPNRETMFTRDLALGPNRIVLDLDRPELRGPLWLRFTRPVGAIVIRSIEARVPAPGD